MVKTDDEVFFVKTAGTLGPVLPDAPKPYFDHSDRVLLLRNAVKLARSCDHLCLARLRNVIESPVGPILIYDKAPGELIGTTKGRRDDPHSAYVRLARLPAERLLGVFDNLLDLHAALAKEGWVAIDLYDGSLILDFATGHLTVIDLDHYRRGPGVNTMGRMFGATRFMAPEEFVNGAPIDQHTTVYTLGRLAWHFCTRLTEDAGRFCGPVAARIVLERAIASERSNRFASVDAFVTAWRAVRDRREG